VAVAAVAVSQIIRIPEVGNLEAYLDYYIWPTTCKIVTQKHWSGHRAVDIACGYTEIYASAEGIVIFAGWDGGYGKTIAISHPNGSITRYSHLSEFKISLGQQVIQGEVIGIQGKSGEVRGKTGIHLHYEVWINGKKVDPLKLYSLIN